MNINIIPCDILNDNLNIQLFFSGKKITRHFYGIWIFFNSLNLKNISENYNYKYF